jgi:hexosaminidase
MNRFCWLWLALLLAVPVRSGAEGGLSELRLRGYSLIPAPQKAVLQDKDVFVDRSWSVESGVGTGHIAYRRLVEGAESLHGLGFAPSGTRKIVLKVAPATVAGPKGPEAAAQAYRLSVSPGRIEITGNADEGLFYGVQSLLQLLRRNPAGDLVLPAGEITDWPDLRLRFMHWDTKHHQNRIETLKRYLDQAAFYKINAVAFEIEDKYEYPRHPSIGAPGAYTRAEMQELTAYALERFIQLVPNVQAPAHMTYVLKHPEFAHLMADSSNYQACMCDEEAIGLILDMYQDMIDATPGVKYFHVSTDEVYYAGICAKCKRPYNEVNRSRTWVDYVNRVHAWMAGRGRTVLAWVEFPLLEKDISLLPRGLIDAIQTPGRSRTWVEAENRAGLPQLAYTPIQGEEFLIPDYFSLRAGSREVRGRIGDALSTVTGDRALGADLIGTFCAAWDDSGLNDETFWLGWVAVTQYGWKNDGPPVDQTVADFMDTFYGPEAPDMVEVYRMLQEQARFYEGLWDRVPSKERGPAYGSSRGKIPYNREDLTLGTPPLPVSGTLAVQPGFRRKYAAKIGEAVALLPQNDRLTGLLYRDIARVSRNRYNVEVLLSLAGLEGYTLRAVLDLARVEDLLVRAAEAAAKNQPASAVGRLVAAYNLSGGILEDQSRMWKDFTAVWEKGQFPKNRTVDGRKFLHVMDDVKDHFADRRAGLDYMLAPFQRMDLPGWRKSLGERIREYAAANKVPVAGLAAERLED